MFLGGICLKTRYLTGFRGGKFKITTGVRHQPAREGRGHEAATPLLAQETALSPRLVALIERLRTHSRYLDQQIQQIERELHAQLQEDDRSRRLLEIPGIGPITASALASRTG